MRGPLLLSLWAALGEPIVGQPLESRTIPSFRVVQIWQADLGGTEGGRSYRLAVCPDGTAFLTDGNGRLTTIDARGTVLREEVHEPLVAARATSCDAESFLAVRRDRLVRISRGSGARVSEAYLPISPAGIAVGGGGTIWVLGGSRETGPNAVVHRVAASGAILSSLTGLPDGRTSTRLLGGSLVWQPKQQRLLVVPKAAYEFHVFSATGGHVTITRHHDPDFRGAEDSPLAAPQASLPDRIERALSLPDDRVLVQVRKFRRVGDGGEVYRDPTHLDVFGPTLDLIGRVDIRRIGVPQGVDGEGNVYFTAATTDGLRVVKGRLERVTNSE
jgi:hypothetical protein